MRIEKVTVRGFKSYKELTEVEFSSGMNVIVGPNGSGKSNLISAIHFALSEEYGKMRPDDRRTLLFNGQDHREPSFVEIQFDNSDRRLPVDADKVTFRRIFGLKKDRLLVNKIEVTEIRTFLDHAGFTNPYFIVKQGKITELSLGSDKDRLHLLKQVAGINMYDANHSKTLQLVKQYNLISEEISGRLETVNERLANLQQEKEDLAKVADLDLNKRAIEYVLVQREREDCELKITNIQTNIDDCRKDWSTSILPKREEHKLNEQKLLSVASKLKKWENDLKLVQLRKARTESCTTPLVEKQEQIKQELADLQQQLSAGTSEIESIDKKLENLRKEQQEKKEDLISNSTKYHELMTKEQMAKEDCGIKETELKTLKQKLSRSSEFDTMAARNEIIEKEMKLVADDRTKNSELVGNIETKIKDLNTKKKELEEIFNGLAEKIQTAQNKLSKINQDLKDPQESLLKKIEERNTLWNNLNNYGDKYEMESQTEREYREKFSRVVGHHFMQGREGVINIMEKFERDSQHELVEGYYGTVLDNISCDEQLNTAVEVAGGAMLSHHIVSNHRISRAIIKEFNDQKMRGEVNFIAIDTVAEPKGMDLFRNPPSVPITRMFDHLSTDSVEVIPAIKFVFGKSLLCQSLELASATAKKYNMTCVTIDGDKVQKNGVLSGGYTNPVTSKIKLHTEWNECMEKLDDLSKSVKKLKKAECDINKEILEAERNIEKTTSMKIRIQNRVEISIKEKEVIKYKLECISDHLKDANKDLSQLKVKQVQLEAQTDSLEFELEQPVGPPNDQDLLNMQNLKNVLRASNLEYTNTCKQRLKQEGARERLQKIIHRNDLLIEQLCVERWQFLPENVSSKIASLEGDRKRLQQEIENKEGKQSEILKDIQAIEQDIRKKKEEERKLLDKHSQLEQVMAAGHPDILKLETNLQFEQERLDACKLKIQNSPGGVPTRVKKYDSQTTKRLLTKLQTFCRKLEKYKHVNPVVLEQYSQLNDKLEDIMSKRGDLELGQERVKEIIEAMEAAKQKQIIQYFGLLQKRFKQVFQSLVPHGRAELVLYGSDFYLSHIPEDEQQLYDLSEDQLTGVRLRVSFRNSSTEAEIATLDQLSGGQKSLVSLALIMAIQKLDPVPIYLFDEVDQALDPDHRAAVAQMIREMSSEAQFVCTTFRQEFVQESFSTFGVGFANISSVIQKITQEQALKFIRDKSVSSSEASGTSDSENGIHSSR